MAQQTAVEWMARQILNLNKSDATWSEIYSQALFMEKEQIIDAWLSGENDGSLEPKSFIEMAEEYYNQKYES
jgi:hypothetical protein